MDVHERAARFFPKAKDWPPAERQKTISSVDMVAPKNPKVVSRNLVPPKPSN